MGNLFVVGNVGCSGMIQLTSGTTASPHPAIHVCTGGSSSRPLLDSLGFAMSGFAMSGFPTCSVLVIVGLRNLHFLALTSPSG